jgi:formylglycine-generating enzyme required for sulfatase activity
MTDQTSPETDPQVQEATERIQSFCDRFTEYHLHLAYHAAFPLSLTPDLLYRLRDYPFQPKLQIPWIAVADLLLSSLCYEVGFELYEMDKTVRKVLLKRLSEDERFGSQRLQELSNFLLKYIERQINHTDSNLIQAQRWTALAYVKPTEAAQQITQKLKKLLQQQSQSDWLQMGFLVETLANPLTEQGFEPLLTLAAGMAKSARGDMWGAENQFAKLREIGNSPTIAGVTVNLPPPPVEAKTFSFDVVTVNKKGRIIKRESREAKYFTEKLPNDIILEMVAIPGGVFTMGSPKTEEGSSEDERPQHQVTVPPFFMGKYTITQAQWRAVASLNKVNRELNPDPSGFNGDDRPVECVSWDDAMEFCARISKYTKKEYRLPSEAEWEYACRAGTKTPFHFGETITTDLVNFNGNHKYGSSSRKGIYREETTPVASFKVANSFGVFDMHGNVWEWCSDTWHDSYQNAPNDTCSWISKNDNDNQLKLLRGGSWCLGPHYCRSASRGYYDAGHRDHYIGFRVVVSGARA